MTQLRTTTALDERMMADDAAEPCEPNQVEIEGRAYARYLERGCLDGFDLDDWLAAEAELRGDSMPADSSRTSEEQTVTG